jgi:hypothetical protein
VVALEEKKNYVYYFCNRNRNLIYTGTASRFPFILVYTNIVYLQFVASRCRSWGCTSWWCHQSNKWTPCDWTGVESNRNKTKSMADICGTPESASAEDVPGHSEALCHGPFAHWARCMWPLYPQYPVNSPQDEVPGA